MNMKTWNLRQWVILCVCLLVLVGSMVAYYGFVPKIYEIDSLRKQLQAAKTQRQRLAATPLPTSTTDEQKRALSLLVPAQLEQTRFLQELHADAKASGAIVKSISFYDPNAEAAKPAGTKSTSKTASAQLPMQMFTGKLSIQGEYQQVRKFLEQVSSMTRLVTFNKWALKAEQPDRTPDVMSNAGSGTVTPTSSGSTVGQSVGTTLANTIMTKENAFQIRQSTSQSPLTVSTLSAAADEIRKQLTADIANDKLLNDLTPIFSEADFGRYAENIRVTVPTLLNQHEIDLANLRIQQGFNRYTAGLLGQQEAESVFDQEVAHLFIPGSNLNIRDVLGIHAPQPEPTPTPQPTPSAPVTPTPTPIVNQPVLSILNSHVFKTVVSLDIDFTIYYAPNALDLLPSQPPIHTYDPTRRSNPVESW